MRPEVMIVKSTERDPKVLLKNLHRGIRNYQDPVTWRTLIVDLREILGSSVPEKEFATAQRSQALTMVYDLVKGTFLEPLIPEILDSLGYKTDSQIKLPPLDLLCFNGRHLPEPLLWSLAEEASSQGQLTAVVNPVGHYNDGETRIVGPSKLLRPVEHLVVLASTQSQQGGSYEVLARVIRLIRNPELAKQVKNLEIVIPMFGGSRGHRLGQDEKIGYEVLEAIFNPYILALPTKHICQKLSQEDKVQVPQVRFFSVDAHNEEYPAKTFTEAGFSFVSISSAELFAWVIGQKLVQEKQVGLPLKIVALDEGDQKRTEALAAALLRFLAKNDQSQFLDLIYIDKSRVRAGEVDQAQVEKVVRWSLNQQDKLITRPRKITGKNKSASGGVIVAYDDMLDTGGTAGKDISLIRRTFPGRVIYFAATHAVLSQGLQALKKVGADHVFVSNTLRPSGLDRRSEVTMVDMAPAILEAILTA